MGAIPGRFGVDFPGEMEIFIVLWWWWGCLPLEVGMFCVRFMILQLHTIRINPKIQLSLEVLEIVGVHHPVLAFLSTVSPSKSHMK